MGARQAPGGHAAAAEAVPAQRRRRRGLAEPHHLRRHRQPKPRGDSTQTPLLSSSAFLFLLFSFFLSACVGSRGWRNVQRRPGLQPRGPASASAACVCIESPDTLHPPCSPFCTPETKNSRRRRGRCWARPAGQKTTGLGPRGPQRATATPRSLTRRPMPWSSSGAPTQIAGP